MKTRVDISVASLGELVTIPVTPLVQGASAWVDAEQDYWTLAKNSGAPEGPDVVAPLPKSTAGGPNARWLRNAGGRPGSVQTLFGPLDARPLPSREGLGVVYYANDSGECFKCLQSADEVYEWLGWPGESVPSVLALWASTIAWWIDPSGGRDTDPGTRASPLRTWAELSRRIRAAGGFAPGLGKVTVTLLGALGPSDPIRRQGLYTPVGTMVVVRGTPTTMYSSVIGDVTEKNPTTRTPWSMTDPSLPTSWTASGLLGIRARIPSGPRAGTTFWPVKDLGGEAARISSPILVSSAFPFDESAMFPTILSGDPFVIEQLTSVDTVLLDGHATPASSDGTAARMVFEDIAFINQPFATANNDGGTVCYLNCHLAQGMLSLDEAYFGCRIGSLFIQFYNACVMTGGYLDETSFGQINGSLTVKDILVQGTNFDIDGGGLITFQGDCGIFDAAGDAGIVLNSNGQGMFDGGGSSRLYGDGNDTFGVVFNGQKLTYLELPTITGTLGDAQVDGITKAWSEFPYLDPTTGGGAVLFASSQRAAGTFHLNGSTPVPISVPGLQESDGLLWWKTADGGTPSGRTPIFTLTPGVGFSVVGEALDLSAFGWKLAKG